MNISSNTIIAITLFLTALTQANAGNNPHPQKKPPPRPSFSTIDINSDGYIDFKEFSSQKAPREDHQKIFDKIDKDDNGVISKAELMNQKPPKKKGRK
jgi:Ca2+-binding EF-hand superfamily protein